MRFKLNMIHWLLAFCSVVNIVVHRIWLGHIRKGYSVDLLTSCLQITIYGVIILFMAMAAGATVFIWKKITRGENITEEEEKYPAVSAGVAAVCFAIFSIYWFLLV